LGVTNTTGSNFEAEGASWVASELDPDLIAPTKQLLIIVGLKQARDVLLTSSGGRHPETGPGST
jgi:hypothetical protein